MVFRSSAAICGAVVALSVSVTMARSETGGVHTGANVKEASGDAIVGAASMYNPFRPGWREGGPKTASGERYDPSAWTAAIKTNLRKKFGGVQFGARPKYALVEGAGKKAIVKITMSGLSRPAASSTSMSGRCAISIRACNWESLLRSRSRHCRATIGHPDRLPEAR